MVNALHAQRIRLDTATEQLVRREISKLPARRSGCSRRSKNSGEPTLNPEEPI
jgi:hypothetical protein